MLEDVGGVGNEVFACVEITGVVGAGAVGGIGGVGYCIPGAGGMETAYGIGAPGMLY